MAYDKTVLSNGCVEIRCAPGDIVHYRFNISDTKWTVDEDPEHTRFQNEGEALDRARLIGRDPDLFRD